MGFLPAVARLARPAVQSQQCDMAQLLDGLPRAKPFGKAKSHEHYQQ